MALKTINITDEKETKVINITVPAPLAPTNLAVIWVDDYALITWDDNTDGRALYEIWESRDGADYILVATTEIGATSYKNYTWQNANMQFKIRANYDGYSSFTDPTPILTTPLVYKIVLPLAQTFAMDTACDIAGGDTVSVDWDDGNVVNYTDGDSMSHDYMAAGTYYPKIKTNINSMKRLTSGPAGSREYNYTNLSKWTLPSSLSNFRFEVCECYGDLSNMILGDSVYYWTVANSNISGFPSGNYGELIYYRAYDCDNISNAEVDDWLSFLNTFYTNNTPKRDLEIRIDGDNAPQVDAANTDIVGIKASYVSAGWTCTETLQYVSAIRGDELTKEKLSLETFIEGLGTGHPSVVDIGAEWNGYRYWLTDTPFPPASNENPSIWASNDGETWVVPSGLTNPVVPQPATGWNNDPDLFYYDNKLYLIWNEYQAIDENKVTWMLESSDGVTWTNKVELYSGADLYMNSPSLIYDGSKFYMYGVGPADEWDYIYRLECDTINGTYGNRTLCTVPIIDDEPSNSWWHIDVYLNDGVYYFAGGGDTNKFHGAKSADGLVFDVSYNHFLRTEYDWEAEPYRPCICPVGDGYKLYYSGLATDAEVTPPGYFTAMMDIELLN